MGKYKAMARTVKKFKVKAARKQLEKSKRSNIRRQKEAMDVQVAKEEESRNQEMEMEEKSGGMTRKNDGRLRKSEMPFVGTENVGRSLSKKYAKTSIDQPTSGVTSKRQLTKKKARKEMRNLRREQRRKKKMTNTMETE